MKINYLTNLLISTEMFDSPYQYRPTYTIFQRLTDQTKLFQFNYPITNNPVATELA